MRIALLYSMSNMRLRSFRSFHMLFLYLLSLRVASSSAFVGRTSTLAALPVVGNKLADLRLLSSATSTDQVSKSSSLSSVAPTVLLKRTRQSKAFRNGNQLVFTRAIESVDRETDVADLVQLAVKLPHESILGWGVYNPHSLYKVRILCHRFLQPKLFKRVSTILNTDGDVAMAIFTMVKHHLESAFAARQALLSTSSEETDTYRLVNGEGDGLSGMAIDVIGGKVAVVMSSALWCQVYQDVITHALEEVLPNCEVVWKAASGRLEQDGAGKLQNRLWDDKPEVDEDAKNRQVLFRENGVTFETFPFDTSQTQKTSVYCDQRENRWHVATLAKDKRVLDLCCYHAGFSLTALVKGGAKSAVAVDSSEAALGVAAENAALNDITDDRIKFVQADVAKFMDEEFERQSFYDLVVLDPPKLAPTAKSLDKARRKYHALNRNAIKVIDPEKGGLLMTCTCSAAMTQKQEYFLNMVQGAALAAGREVTLLRVSGAASCHTQSPISWPTGAYLTAAVFYVHPEE